MECMYVYTHCASLGWIERVLMSSLRATVCLSLCRPRADPEQSAACALIGLHTNDYRFDEAEYRARPMEIHSTDGVSSSSVHWSRSSSNASNGFSSGSNAPPLPVDEKKEKSVERERVAENRDAYAIESDRLEGRGEMRRSAGVSCAQEASGRGYGVWGDGPSLMRTSMRTHGVLPIRNPIRIPEDHQRDDVPITNQVVISALGSNGSSQNTESPLSPKQDTPSYPQEPDAPASPVDLHSPELASSAPPTRRSSAPQSLSPKLLRILPPKMRIKQQRQPASVVAPVPSESWGDPSGDPWWGCEQLGGGAGAQRTQPAGRTPHRHWKKMPRRGGVIVRASVPPSAPTGTRPPDETFRPKGLARPQSRYAHPVEPCKTHLGLDRATRASQQGPLSHGVSRRPHTDQ